jgi:hypothetical protein
MKQSRKPSFWIASSSLLAMTQSDHKYAEKIFFLIFVDRIEKMSTFAPRNEAG